MLQASTGLPNRPRRRAIYIQTLLRLLADDHPAYASELTACAVKVLRKSSRSLDADLQKVLAVITHLGCNTIEDISAQTKIPPATVQKRLNLLLDEGLVYRARQELGIKRGRGGDNRSYLYWPTEEMP